MRLARLARLAAAPIAAPGPTRYTQLWNERARTDGRKVAAHANYLKRTLRKIHEAV